MRLSRVRKVAGRVMRVGGSWGDQRPRMGRKEEKRRRRNAQCTNNDNPTE